MLQNNNLIGFGSAGSTQDSLFSSVALLLSMDGANNGTTFTDAKGNTVTRTGSPVTVSSPVKFGTASGSFPSNGSYLTVTPANDFRQWWTTPLSIEAWVYSSNFGTWATGTPTQPRLIGDMTPGASTNFWSFGPNQSGGISFYYYNGAQQVISSANSLLSANTWAFIQFIHDGSGNITLALNGSSVATGTKSGTPQSDSNPICIGQVNSAAIVGNVDDLRVTKAVRPIAVPSSAFPTS